MNRNWIKTKDRGWINLDHSYWIFVRCLPNEDGLYYVCADFIESGSFEIDCYKTKELAYDAMNDLMNKIEI